MRPESRLAARPHFDERDLPGILDSVGRVLRSGKLVLGDETEALEREFARDAGVKHAVAVSSCTAALEIALRALGVAGRETVVPTNTFAATAAAAVRAAGVVVPTSASATADAAARAGARISFYGCDDDGNSSVDDALSKITASTAAVVVVYVAGFVPRDFGRLVAECRRLGVPLVEDCAHAHGALADGRAVGSLRGSWVLLVLPDEITTCGVGGMVTTDREDVVRLAKSLRHHGQGTSLEEVVAVGHDWLMDETRAVMLRAQVKRLPEALAARRAVAAAYDEAVARSRDPRVESPVVASGTSPSYYKYPVRLPDWAVGSVVRHLMAARGIGVGQLYWPPVHLMPAYRALSVEGMSLTEKILRRRVCLPMHAMVDPADCAEIVSELLACLDELETGRAEGVKA